MLVMPSRKPSQSKSNPTVVMPKQSSTVKMIGSSAEGPISTMSATGMFRHLPPERYGGRTTFSARSTKTEDSNRLVPYISVVDCLTGQPARTLCQTEDTGELRPSGVPLLEQVTTNWRMPVLVFCGTDDVGLSVEDEAFLGNPISSRNNGSLTAAQQVTFDSWQITQSTVLTSNFHALLGISHVQTEWMDSSNGKRFRSPLHCKPDNAPTCRHTQLCNLSNASQLLVQACIRVQSTLISILQKLRNQGRQSSIIFRTALRILLTAEMGALDCFNPTFLTRNETMSLFSTIKPFLGNSGRRKQKNEEKSS
ncbi:hypothetical protein QFC20_000563 [Naganishia adeliensis]|uniref:Uncharacterized protein n=1 Tax=Naganishia adeliensis TaxID=92952 RepID=A0ACC2WZ78_9TREE|nr:hypothetical protein QFC20_000563 [Naganishia adeliensis]